MLYIVAAIAIVIADQLLKHWVTVNIALGQVRGFIPGILSLTHTRNTGAAFSMLSEHTWILAAISVAASAVLFYLTVKKTLPKWERFSVALILGGCVGNAIDRVFLGYVVDMFMVEFVNFAIFNLADVFIDVGAALFVILYLVRASKEEKAAKRSEDKSGD